jgi:hypothetical protein
MNSDRVFEGTVHAHSTHSYDGRLTYPELREFFGSRGLQFVCMTEHIEYLGQGDVDRIIDDCRANSDGDFLFVPGIEMDCFVIHFLGVDHTTIDFATNRAIFDSLHAVARLCVFAHPVKARFSYPQWLIDRCDGVEVLNTKHDGQHYFRPQSEALHRRVLKDRPRAVRLAAMDFHGPKDFSAVRMRLSRQGELTESFVLDALADGAFEVFKNSERMDDYGYLRRGLARTRIRLMDAAHGIHRRVADRGIAVPSGLKRTLRKLFEGR